jgi:hypothetical protein
MTMLRIIGQINQVAFASEFISGMGLYEVSQKGKPQHMLVLRPFDGTLLHDGLDRISTPRHLTNLPTPRQYSGLSPDDTAYWHSKIDAFGIKADLFMQRLVIDLGMAGIEVSNSDRRQVCIIGDVPRALELIQKSFTDAEIVARRGGIRVVVTDSGFSTAANAATEKRDEMCARLDRLSRAMGEDSPLFLSVKRVILDGLMSEHLKERLRAFTVLASTKDVIIKPISTVIHTSSVVRRGPPPAATIG